MIPKWKKVIAREGLIIIFCIVCAGFFSFLQNFIPDENPNYSYVVKTQGHKYLVTTEEPVYVHDVKDKVELFHGLRQRYPDDLGRDDGNDFVPDDLTIGSPKAQYTLNGHLRNFFGNAILFFVFIAYPLCLIIRFIFWAIRTIRQ